MKKFDITIVGAGIVGLSTGWELAKRFPGLQICVLEKEKEIARHQTGHNSGVIHSGIYYKPGSLKALNCRRGIRLLKDFCQANGVPYEITGKVIVATEKSELPMLDTLLQRGMQNGIQGIEKISAEQIKEREPHVAALAGLWVPETGIIDFRAVATKIRELFENYAQSLLLNHELKSVSSKENFLILETDHEEFESKYLINCAGLHSDRVARICGLKPQMEIIPFRGSYYKIKPERKYLVKNLIYPVPDPRYPFLGVHFSRMINGDIEAGPNASLSLNREGYENMFDISWTDFLAIFSSLSFWKMAGKYWRTGIDEIGQSLSKNAFTRNLRKLIPEIGEDDLIKGLAGIRAQAVDKKGNLLDDFYLERTDKMLHVLNAPSPAATASLSIAQTIADEAALIFNFG
jgi:L-2-hydroxyglutarate oxidase